MIHIVLQYRESTCFNVPCYTATERHECPRWIWRKNNRADYSLLLHKHIAMSDVVVLWSVDRHFVSLSDSRSAHFGGRIRGYLETSAIATVIQGLAAGINDSNDTTASPIRITIYPAGVHQRFRPLNVNVKQQQQRSVTAVIE